MTQIKQPRAGSGCGILSVSCSFDMIQKMRRLGISASDAFRRGLSFCFKEIEGEETPDALTRTIDKLYLINEEHLNTIEQLNKKIEILKSFRRGGRQDGNI